MKENYKLKVQSDSTFSCYAFDLQKVLNSPYGENGLFYYSRNFSMYNVTFTDLADKSGFCYCWDQTVAQRGSNEIGSCINMHLKENIMKSEVRHVAYFSDNCPGQNKNRFVYHTFSLSTMIIENFEVELVFLEKGHTKCK